MKTPDQKPEPLSALGCIGLVRPPIFNLTNMQLDTINTLYLELSQVATATTAKELALKKELSEIDAALWPDGDRPANYEPDRALRISAILHIAKKNAARIGELETTLKDAIEKRAQINEWRTDSPEVTGKPERWVRDVICQKWRAILANTHRQTTPPESHE